MLDLPKTREESWKFYKFLQDTFLAQGPEQWRECERSLGKNDLFYLLARLLRRPDMNRDWLFDRIREVQAAPDGHLDLWFREAGKALARDTPMLTTNRGWTTHGELVPGDLVWSPEGRDVAVIATQHFSDGPCYQVTFSRSGSKIVAHANHLWRIRRNESADEVVTTEWLAQHPHLHRDVGACSPLPSNRPEIALSLDPHIIKAVERVDSVPTNCIQVEGNGLYCAGRELIPTHNSSILTFGLTLQNIIQDPEITIGIFSHTRPMAKGFLSVIKRELETNNYLVQLYPEIFWDLPSKQSPKWSEDGGLIVKRKSNPKEATIEAYGLVDGTPTGKHFSLRVYDDVVPNILSPDMIAKTVTAWDLSQNLGTVGGRVRYIGTRYQIHDVYSTILERGAAKPRIYAATHNGRMDGTPVFFSVAEWEKKLRNSSRAIIASQQLQNPLADEDAIFRAEWLKSYEVRPRTMNAYVLCDPSRGRYAHSDQTAIAVIGIAAGGAKYLLDGVLHRMTLSQRWIALRTLYHRWSGTNGIQHIDVGYERFGAQSDDEYFQEQMELEARRKVPNAYFTIRELSWPREGGNSKRERIERLEPDFRQGRFFLPAPILHDNKPSVWSPVTDPEDKLFGTISYNNAGGLTKAQMSAISGGSTDLVAKAIVVRDPAAGGERGARYDLTARFIDQYTTFPFGSHDDLLDAVSRIYDMDPIAPITASQRQDNPEVYCDGI